LARARDSPRNPVGAADKPWKRNPESERECSRRPNRRSLRLAVSIDQTGPEQSSSRHAPGMLEKPVDPCVDRPRIGIQDKHVGASGCPHTGVHAGAEAYVVVHCNQASSGKFFPHQFGASIGGSVIDDYELMAERRDRVQAGSEEIARVIRNDHDREAGGTFMRLLQRNDRIFDRARACCPRRRFV
jgi:hypothetical protein